MRSLPGCGHDERGNNETGGNSGKLFDNKNGPASVVSTDRTSTPSEYRHPEQVKQA